MRAARIGLLLLCLASVAIIVVCRVVIGPADLYEKDQPKTLAYTADVLLHGRWALPRDVIYQPATKPPLYNWIAAGVMRVSGCWSELAMKSPSVIGAIGVGVLLLTAGRRPWHERLAHECSNAADDEHERGAHAAWTVGLLAAAIWFAFGVEPRHASTMRLMFLARPDMLQAFFLTAAWLAATRALRPPPAAGWGEGVGGRESATRRESSETIDLAASVSAARSALSPSPSPGGKGGPEAFAFWACLIGAILTKGPLALLLLVYAPIAARVVAGEWRAVRVLRPIVGVVATVLVIGAWVACADRVDPQHVRSVMLGAEVVDRVTQATPEGFKKPFYDAAMWFFSKGGPFAFVAALTAAATIISRRWFRRPDAITLGASLWLIVLLVGLSLPAGKRMDYLLPTYAPAAWLAARLLIAACERAAVPITVVGVAPLVMSGWLGHANLTSFHEAKSHWSDRAVAFCAEVRARVHDEPLLVIVRGKHPLPVLLHRHQGSALTIDDLRNAKWIILPTTATTATPLITSDPVPIGFETIEERATATLGLYRATDVPMETLVAAQRAVGQWTGDENPYHEPGTVWRE